MDNGDIESNEDGGIEWVLLFESISFIELC